MKKEYYLILTDRCQWNCWYCDFTYKKQTLGDVDYDYLKYFIDIMNDININKDIDFILEGGEIGLINKNILNLIFNSNLSDKYSITTNGKFMENNYHNIYKNNINDIQYHVISDLNANNMTFNKYSIDDSINVCYTFVIHKNNIKYLNNFLDINSDYNFTPHLLQPRITNLNFLTLDNIKEIYNIVKDKNNINNEFKERLNTIINYLSLDDSVLNKIRYTCCNLYYKPYIDLVNKKINRCCVSTSNNDSVELNKDNLIKLYNNDITLFNKTDELCNNCIASYVWRHNLKYMFDNNREELFKIIKTLKENNKYEIL